jgi:hypothetical protein
MRAAHAYPLIPANAGIHSDRPWIPAFAGMRGCVAKASPLTHPSFKP